MKLLSCFVLATVSAFSFSSSLSGQETGSDQKIAEMQSIISNLQTELDSMKAAQANVPVARPQIDKPSPAVRVISGEPTPASYPAPVYSTPYGNNYPPVAPQYATPQYATPQYATPQYATPQFERVYLPQPPVVFVEPAYCPPGSYCDPGYGGVYGGGFGGGGVYAGPNGWGLSIGGLQLDFSGHGHGGNNGHGGHNGHGGNKSHKGNKGHKH